EDDGVAAGQRRGELPGRDRGGEVPGRDQADDSERTAHRVDRAPGQRLLRQLTERPVALAAEEAKDRRRARGLHPGLAQRLAHLAGHLARDLLDATVDLVGRLDKQVAAL